VKPEIKKLWIDALRSGKYKQSFGELFGNGCHCALGVLVEVAIEQGTPVKRSPGGYVDTIAGQACMEPENVGLTPNVVAFAGMSNCPAVVTKLNPLIGVPQERRDYITTLNDNDKLTFEKLADLLEKTEPENIR
jgi:hypothetical protein